jgi:hypothetical protein
MFALHERDRVEAVISKSHVCISDFVALRLALGLTYCRTARLASCPVKRHRLVTLAGEALSMAGEALSMAEEYVDGAPPDLFCDVSQSAKRLRLEIRQLNENSGIAFHQAALTANSRQPLVSEP